MTPAIERLLNVAFDAKMFIASEHGPIPLVKELRDAINAVDQENYDRQNASIIEDRRRENGE